MLSTPKEKASPRHIQHSSNNICFSQQESNPEMIYLPHSRKLPCVLKGESVYVQLVCDLVGLMFRGRILAKILSFKRLIQCLQLLELLKDQEAAPPCFLSLMIQLK